MSHQNIYKEACVETMAEALFASAQGANRLEYCRDLQADGLTPSLEEITELLGQIDIPVKIMIRPRAGDFCYDEKDLATMAKSIQVFKALPIAGFVTGALTKENKIDVEVMKRLATAAAPLPITFHKAIDSVADKIEAIDQLKEIDGIDSILSSGSCPTALEGKETLREMLDCAGTALRIIPAGKITSQNLLDVHQAIGAQEYHGRKIVAPMQSKTQKMEIKNLAQTSLADITDCFNRSFADYIVKFEATEEQLRARWKAGRVDYESSFGAFAGDQLVGFFISGVDDYNGKRTAFNMATGVIPAFRGRRIVKQLYEHAFPHFRAIGIRQCMLEVIVGNDIAIKAYQSVGFEIGRTLHCFSGSLNLTVEEILPPLRFRKTAVPRWKKYKSMEPYAPSWEHTAAAIDLARKEYEYWEFYEGDVLQGFFCGKKENGFTPHVWVNPARWNDLGPFLFARMATRFGKLKINNVESTATDLIGLLKRRKLKNTIDQYEMKMDL